LNAKESQLGDLKKNIELQQAEMSKAESKLKTSLEEVEKIKANFDAERIAWETDKAALQKRAEDAEAELMPVTEELAGLKEHICQMLAAIFGKTHIQLTIHFDISLTRLAIPNIQCLTRLATLVQKIEQAPEVPILVRICCLN
jgi:hypothetical protein